MELVLVLQIVLLVVLLALSGFFSGSETALFSLSQTQLSQMGREGHPRRGQILDLLDDPRRLIVTILIGNELVNVAAANISAILLMDIMEGEGKWWLNIFVMLPILLLVGEITPKTLAVRNNIAFSSLVAQPLALITRIILPLRWVVSHVSEFFIDTLIGKSGAKSYLITEEMVRNLVNEATKEGHLELSEKEYIHNIFDFGNQTVGEVMTPRSKISFLDVDAPITDVLDTLARDRVTRRPVRVDGEGQRERILGILHFRDLLGVDLSRFQKAADLEGFLRTPYMVPASKPLATLFRTFRERRISIALVVDEFGAVIGLATMEDLLESIFGDIRSESDTTSALTVRQEEGGSYQMDGGMSLELFNEQMGCDLHSELGETIGGLLLHLCGEVPTEGEVVKVAGLTFTVAEMDGTRIAKVIAARSGGMDDVHPVTAPNVLPATAPEARPSTEPDVQPATEPDIQPASEPKAEG